jgi:hypothetical protein
MMTHQLQVSILSAPLAAIDRRVLSQAWYSALHLARDRSRAAGEKSRVAAPKPASCERLPDALARPETQRSEAAAVRTRKPDELRFAAFAERRSARCDLARRIEHAFLRRAGAVARATFTLGTGSGRIVVLLQRANGTGRLLAICSPRLRETVARALAQARFALASRGIALEASVETNGAA